VQIWRRRVAVGVRRKRRLCHPLDWRRLGL